LADRYHGSKPVGWTDEIAAELKEAMASTWSGSPRGSTSPSSTGRYTGSSCTTRTPTGTPRTRTNCREKSTPADDPATVERELGKPDTRDEFEGVRKVNGKPRDELWHKYGAKGYWIIFRRLPGEPDRIHSISIGEPEKK